MYHRSVGPRSAPPRADESPRTDPAAFARLVADRVRAALTAFTPGMPFDPSRYRDALVAPVASVPEDERLFCLGWLHWLNGDPAAAESHLADAADRTRGAGSTDRFVVASYWRARVGLLLRRADAVATYETVLRQPGISPRATAWFVDLLWRAGRVDRAEQVLKTVRGNRRFAACDEVPLLEARFVLRRGELAAGERILSEAAPTGCVAQAERWLLLAWAAASQNKPIEASQRLEQARHCLYPAAAFETWQKSVARRAAAESTPASVPVPAVCAEFVRGQEHRLAGRREEAAESYRAALDSPAVPFARYALARMGEDDLAALLTSRPGLFLALRCRAQIALARFLRREASPAECLDALQLAGTVGYGGGAVEHFRTVATALRQRNPEPAALRELAATSAADPAAQRNFLRAAVEQASRRAQPADAIVLLHEWSSLAPDDLRVPVERQLQRQRLLAATESGPGADLLPLVDSVLASPTAELLRHPTALWSAARAIAEGAKKGAGHGGLLQLTGRWQPLALALLLRDAAARKDAAAVTALLDDADAWRAFGARPPRFVVAALEHVVTARPDQPVREEVLSRWLSLWQSTVSEVLAARVTPGSRIPAPPGVSAGAWDLHQASRALAREDYCQALGYVAGGRQGTLTADSAAVVNEALPGLERCARAQQLAAAFRCDGIGPVSATLLVDAVDQLPTEAAEAIARNDLEAIGAALADTPGLSPRLAHHLALLEHRRAVFLDAAGRVAEAVQAHRRGWGWWQRFLAADPPDGPAPTAAGLLVETLLGGHRRCVNALLSRGAVDGARLHWELVAELPALAARLAPPRAEDFAARVARFRDELATDFLLATREAMRHGPAPDGFRADYEAGLAGLRRILSLDRDNPRLLTALLDTCGDWFFDLYNAGARSPLAEQVERFTPFALQLARQVEGRPGDLAARAALAGFTKFRGFVAVDTVRKAELYREALRFNPADDNVRDLLAQLEGPDRGPVG
jgi:tetratricopeptide (TPR) repeat protein